MEGDGKGSSDRIDQGVGGDGEPKRPRTLKVAVPQVGFDPLVDAEDVSSSVEEVLDLSSGDAEVVDEDESLSSMNAVLEALSHDGTQQLAFTAGSGFIDRRQYSGNGDEQYNDLVSGPIDLDGLMGGISGPGSSANDYEMGKGPDILDSMTLQMAKFLERYDLGSDVISGLNRIDDLPNREEDDDETFEFGEDLFEVDDTPMTPVEIQKLHGAEVSAIHDSGVHDMGADWDDIVTAVQDTLPEGVVDEPSSENLPIGELQGYDLSQYKPPEESVDEGEFDPSSIEFEVEEALDPNSADFEAELSQTPKEELDAIRSQSQPKITTVKDPLSDLPPESPEARALAKAKKLYLEAKKARSPAAKVYKKQLIDARTSISGLIAIQGPKAKGLGREIFDEDSGRVMVGDIQTIEAQIREERLRKKYGLQMGDESSNESRFERTLRSLRRKLPFSSRTVQKEQDWKKRELEEFVMNGAKNTSEDMDVEVNEDAKKERTFFRRIKGRVKRAASKVKSVVTNFFNPPLDATLPKQSPNYNEFLKRRLKDSETGEFLKNEDGNYVYPPAIESLMNYDRRKGFAPTPKEYNEQRVKYEKAVNRKRRKGSLRRGFVAGAALLSLLGIAESFNNSNTQSQKSDHIASAEKQESEKSQDGKKNRIVDNELLADVTTSAISGVNGAFDFDGASPELPELTAEKITFTVDQLISSTLAGVKAKKAQEEKTLTSIDHSPTADASDTLSDSKTPSTSSLPKASADPVDSLRDVLDGTTNYSVQYGDVFLRVAAKNLIKLGVKNPDKYQIQAHGEAIRVATNLKHGTDYSWQDLAEMQAGKIELSLPENLTDAQDLEDFSRNVTGEFPDNFNQYIAVNNAEKSQKVAKAAHSKKKPGLMKRLGNKVAHGFTKIFGKRA